MEIATSATRPFRLTQFGHDVCDRLELIPPDNPAALIHLCRPTPVMGEKDQVGFAVSVFNGSRRPIKLSAEPTLQYGPPVNSPNDPPKVVRSSDVLLSGFDQEVSPGASRDVRVMIRMNGPLGEEIKQDVAAGRLKSIRVDGLHVRANGSPLPPPAVWFNLPKSEQWELGLGHGIGASNFGRHIIEPKVKVE